MNDYSSAFQFACAPGPDAAAALMRVADAPVLVVYLDPVNLTIQVPASPEGGREMAGFCRELAHEAATLARILDPDGEAAQLAAVIDPTGEAEAAGVVRVAITNPTDLEVEA